MELKKLNLFLIAFLKQNKLKNLMKREKKMQIWNKK